MFIVTYIALLVHVHVSFQFLKVFEINDVKAWKSVLVSVASYTLGLVMIAKAPWYLLPLAWAWTGTAITGVSLIAFLSILSYLLDLQLGILKLLFLFPPQVLCYRS